ncbi:hypothetical protein XA68_11432 [Ophiocordyceps unilateralis]|uniref:Uncharacterized protein n=1 Tax=Ophiocordyceps unilateralis TaxID=268505 RepID=A0A2A9PQH1_OPHUN|nr:hypothetical protein XA68_11432 [Ophiocordyceps unilateralis]
MKFSATVVLPKIRLLQGAADKAVHETAESSGQWTRTIEAEASFFQLGIRAFRHGRISIRTREAGWCRDIGEDKSSAL